MKKYACFSRQREGGVGEFMVLQNSACVSMHRRVCTCAFKDGGGGEK